MAGYYRYTAVFDACVLYPAALRDVLLSLAAEGMFRARWSDRIHEEWPRSLLAKRPDLQRDQLARTIEVEVLHPDDFLVAQYDLAQIAVLTIVKSVRKRLKNPPRSADEFISVLEALGLPQFCSLLRQASDLI